VAEGHDDLGDLRPRAQEPDDLLPERRAGLAGHRGDALGVEEDHAGPADAPRGSVRRGEVHDEEVALVVERVLAELELRHRLAAEVLEQGEVFLPSLEGLLHRDHAVSEHPGLAH
jgi:hypothetical protein